MVKLFCISQHECDTDSHYGVYIYLYLSIYSQLCYINGFKNADVFQDKCHIREQWKHNTQLFCLLMRYLHEMGNTTWMQKLKLGKFSRNKLKTCFSNTFQPLHSTSFALSHTSSPYVTTFHLISRNPPSTTSQ